MIKTKTPGIYVSHGKTKTTYTVMYSVRVADQTTKTGWKWKPAGRTFPTFSAAVDFKVKNQAENRGGQNLEPTDMTMEELCREWLEYKKPNLEIQTYLFYSVHINNYLIPDLGNIKATHLTPQAIRSASVKWQEKVCWNTVKGIFGTLNQIYGFGVREHDFKQNPMDKVERRQRRGDEKGKAIEVYSVLELKQLLAATEPGLERTFLMTAAHTGLRAAEMCGLCWDAIDLRAGTLEVKRSLIELSKNRGGPFLGPPKNKNAYRKVNLAPEVISELRHWKLQCPPHVDNHAFVSMFGKPVRKISANYMLMKCCKRAGIKILSMKALRHTFASQHVIMGTSLPELSAMMGHYSPKLTLDIYTHWTKAEKSTAQAAFANRIKMAAEEEAQDKTVGE